MVNSSDCSYQGDLVCGLCECVEGWLVVLWVVCFRRVLGSGCESDLGCFHIVFYRIGERCQCNTADNTGLISLMCPYVHRIGV